MTKKKKTLIIIAWAFIIATFIYALASCSPVKKLDRLQKKHSYLFEKKIDTLKYYDTSLVTIPGFKYDTNFPLFKMSQAGGLNLSKENLHINLFHDKETDNVVLNAEVDTVHHYHYKLLEIPYNRFLIDPPKKAVNFLQTALIVLYAATLLIMLLIFYNTRKK